MRAPRSASSISVVRPRVGGQPVERLTGRGEHRGGVGGQAGERVVVVLEARGVREEEPHHAGRLAEQADALLHERRGLDEHGLLARR